MHTLDFDRVQRRGIPETILGTGKSPEQVVALVRDLSAAGQPALVTRVEPAVAEAVVAAFPDVEHDPAARCLLLGRSEAPPAGDILVVTAGSSDLPVAHEALFVGRALGARMDLVADCGVAGIDRILAHTERLRTADVVIVIAGMDGALPSVVAGLVASPVVAVPTSVGYGASFEGLAALLTMLSSCAEGVTVVNIDNGFGAAVSAVLMTRIGSPRP